MTPEPPVVEGKAPAPQPPPSAPFAGLRLAFATLTILRLPVNSTEATNRRTAGIAMACAPLVGLVLGAAAALTAWAVHWYSASPTLAAVAAVATLAALTRGLHLDGLADTADGLGSAKPAPAALDIMKRSDIGPFGVVTITLTLATQIAALSTAYAHDGSAIFGRGAVAVLTAAVAGRLAITVACTPRVPSARPTGLGAWVARSVNIPTAAAVTALCLATCTALGLLINPPTAALAAAAIPISLLAAGLLLRRCIHRFGGITGDVLGALTETATSTALLVLAFR